MTAAHLERANERPTQAPKNAFCLDANRLQFAAGEGSGSSAPIEMLARTGAALQHWFWGQIVHDFAGMQHRDSIPIDYEHDTSDPIGVVNTFSVRDGDLYLGGSIESLEPGDDADKIIKLAKRGIPYQASIYFDPENLLLEELPEGMQAVVNEREIEGPAVICRQWVLRGVAVTPHGYDIGTHSKFSASQAGAFTLNWRASEMSQTETAPADVVETEEVVVETVETVAAVATEETETPELTASQLTKARQMLGLFAEHFGQTAAATYFAAGHNLTAAALAHIKAQNSEIAELTARAEKAEQRLAAAALNLGEKDSINTGTPASTTTKTAASLFRKIGSAR